MNDLPLGDRIRLAHAALQATAEECGADLLHIKGYATTEGFYRSTRSSSDADILVRPCDVDLMVRTLETKDWHAVTHFESGSAFGHAMTLYHEWWGSVDLHRLFPGIVLDPDRAFDLLWANRIVYPIAHFPCLVPSYLDQVLLIVLHTGRDGQRGSEDLEYLRKVLSDEDMDRIRQRGTVLGSELGLAAALGELERYSDHPDYRLWKVMSEGGTRLEEWRARFASAHGLRAKAAVLRSMTALNHDHLAMRLGHEPDRADLRQARAERRKRARQEIRDAARAGVARALREMRAFVVGIRLSPARSRLDERDSHAPNR